MDSVLGRVPEGTPLDQLLDLAVDPLVEYHLIHPACIVLFIGPDSPQRLADLHQPLHESMLERIGALLAAIAPQVPAERLHRAAEVAVHMFKGVLPLVLAAAPEDRPLYVAELKLSLAGYFGLLLASD
ncbi:hypothetical protein GXW82_40405 [Streptacidiphilus sp. 4-A2]|nr:hypothetical protein [Streptacidiphilus sp. 4-A2]